MGIQVMQGCDIAVTQADVEAQGAFSFNGSIGVGSSRDGTGVYILDGQSNSRVSWSYSFFRHTTVSLWFYIDSATIETLFNIIEVQDSATPTGLGSSSLQHAACIVQTNGSIVMQGDVGIRGTTAAGIITPQTWHHMEFQVDCNAAGNGKLVVDGVTLLDVAGDFVDSANNASVLIYAANSRVLVDDIVIQNDASTQQPLLGRHKIETLLPNGAGNSSDFTGAFTDIDDPLNANDGDTTTITSSTLNAKSDFGMGNIAGAVASIAAVKPVVVFKKSDSGVTGITPYLRSGTTDYADTAELASTEAYAVRIGEIREVDPDTAVAWTESGVNAANVGIEITT